VEEDFLVIVEPSEGRFRAHAYSLKDYRLDFVEAGRSEMERSRRWRGGKRSERRPEQMTWIAGS
jgi:hypothetical protein